MDAASSKVVACDHCGKKNRVPAAAPGSPRCGNCGEVVAWIADADDQSFAAVVDAAKLPVLLDLWAPWCGPCRMVSPALESLAHQNAGTIKLVKVNVDDAPHISQRFQAQSIPMLVVLHDGKAIDTQIGAASEGALKVWLARCLATIKARAASAS